MSVRSKRRLWLGLGTVAALGLVWWLIPAQTSGRVAAGEPEAGAAAAGGGGVSAKGLLGGGQAGRSGSPEAAEDGAWNPGGDEEPTSDDAQHWEWLEQDLELLIDQTRPKARKRLEAGEFEKRYLKASIEHLRLAPDEQVAFEKAAHKGLAAIDEARTQMQDAQQDSPYDENDGESVRAWRDIQQAFDDQQREAAAELAGALPRRRRTTMMRENTARWLIRLDFGIQHANRAPSR